MREVLGMGIGVAVGIGIRIRMIGCVEDDYSEEHVASARGEGGCGQEGCQSRTAPPRALQAFIRAAGADRRGPGERGSLCNKPLEITSGRQYYMFYFYLQKLPLSSVYC